MNVSEEVQIAGLAAGASHLDRLAAEGRISADDRIAMTVYALNGSFVSDVFKAMMAAKAEPCPSDA